MGIVLFLCILFVAASVTVFVKMTINLFKIRKNWKRYGYIPEFILLEE